MLVRLCDTKQIFFGLPPEKKWFTRPVPHLHGKNWASSFLMKSIKEKIVAAMKSCNMSRIAEGALYYSLFKTGTHYDDATRAIQELLGSGVLYRSGGTFILTTHGKEDSYREGPVRFS